MLGTRITEMKDQLCLCGAQRSAGAHERHTVGIFCPLFKKDKMQLRKQSQTSRVSKLSPVNRKG